ncbi:MAG: hypothetical protein DWQ01_01785 [Planctomycetota bacterium]|nr:MAG: hypothetical protein DWQ01_01785 [Planctomycetota bacterium]
MTKLPSAFLLLVLLFGCTALEQSLVPEGGKSASVPPAAGLQELQALAESFGNELTLPVFENSPEELTASLDRTLKEADRRLNKMAWQEPASATFENTILVMDDVVHLVQTMSNRLYLTLESHGRAEMREAAGRELQRLQAWEVKTRYREDIFMACRAFDELYVRARRPQLRGENLKLYRETMRDFKRDGLHLNAGDRDRLEALQNELNQLAQSFDENITDAVTVTYYSEEELEGVPDSFLRGARQEDGKIQVRATVVTDYLAVMENAVNEDVRRRLKELRYRIVQAENGPILDRMLAVRDEIAEILGYGSWADYRIEPKMAGTAANAVSFLERFVDDLDPKFDQEVEAMRQLKAEETGNPEAELAIWDFRYYMNQLRKQQYQVDTEALRVYFQYERVLAGLFDVYEQIFGLEFLDLPNPQEWAPGVSLHACLDAESGEPLGLFYLDMFPREGKYNHFAQFDVIGGKKLDRNRYQRPVAALLCNFTPANEEQPSLLSHSEVETLFHEFGHLLHTVLTRSSYARFSGANVPRDFVEAPSQTLENWCWDEEVLHRFAVDYRNPSKRIDGEVLERMRQADLATKGTYYRRQLALALSDLRMHLRGRNKNAMTIANQTFEEVFMAVPEDSHFSAYWGHLTGYDAGYYGYAWADAIAADLATLFERAPKGYLDPEAGRRLRREIYEQGDSRDVSTSIRRCLGRDPSHEAFVKSLGIQPR